MYEKFFNFSERPFEITPDPMFVYLSEQHKEALSYLRYAVQEGKGFSVITGEAGTGKTTLVHTLLGKLDDQVRTSFIFNPILDQADFLNYVCDDFGIDTGNLKTRGQSLKALHDFLLECFARKEKVFIIIDEAQSLKPELLHEVRLLTNLETSKKKLLHVILLGQPELDDILEEPEFRPLKQRITVRYYLRSLNRKETAEYIIHRLKKAGSKRIDIFDRGAVDQIFAYSRGIPRLINIICDNALLTGFSLDKRIIEKNIIRNAARDLGTKGKNEKMYISRIILLVIIVVAGSSAIFFLDRIFKYWR